MDKKQFPLHSTGRMIPWSVAERAYEVYSKRYGTSQTLERLAQRGGFGAEELDDMVPGWREEVEEVYLLRAEVERLARENSSVTDLLKAAHDENEKEQGRWQDAIYNLLGELAPGANIDGGGCDSGDPLDLTLAEIAQGFSYWDNLLFDTMESVSHSYVDTPTFKAAADLITKMHAENEQISQQVCSDCDPENYGWVFNRVEGKAACGCIVEAEPFQMLLKALERLAKGEHSGSFFLVEQIAKEALRSVLPMDYQEPV